MIPYALIYALSLSVLSIHKKYMDDLLKLVYIFTLSKNILILTRGLGKKCVKSSQLVDEHYNDDGEKS